MQGGAIYAYGYGGTVTLTISNTQFTSNAADYQVKIWTFERKKRARPLGPRHSPPRRGAGHLNF